jgi:hypothetical protein
MDIIYGKAGSGKTTFFKQTHAAYEERTIEKEEELLSLLSYSKSEFREELIPLLVNVWFDFDYRKFKMDYSSYPLVTLECHKKCLPGPIQSQHIEGGINPYIFRLPTNGELFPLLGYKTTYWNNEENDYLPIILNTKH